MAILCWPQLFLARKQHLCHCRRVTPSHTLALPFLSHSHSTLIIWSNILHHLENNCSTGSVNYILFAIQDSLFPYICSIYFLSPSICCCHIFCDAIDIWCHIVWCYPGFVVAAHRNVHKFSFQLSLHWKVQSVKLLIKAILLNFLKWLNLHICLL